MTDAPDKPASPACSLDEAPESYRGYFTAEEIAGQVGAIAAALEQLGRSDLAVRLRELTPADAGSPAVTDISAAFDQLLPRIADDRLHARLREIRDAL